MKIDNFGQFIKEIREENQLTQQQLADKYHITTKTVSNWEHNRCMPDEALIEQIKQDFKRDDYVEPDEYVFSSQEKDLRNKIYIVSIIALSLLIACTLSIKQPASVNNFTYKALENVCSKSSITANAEYDKNLSILYLTDINNCGDTDDTKYDSIEGILYAINDAKTTDNEINTDYYNKAEAITIAEYLKNITIPVDDTICQNELYIELICTKNGRETIARVPIISTNNCLN